MPNAVSPAKGLKDVLVALAAAAVPPVTLWPITIGRLLDEDNQVAIMDTGGPGPWPDKAVDYVTVQFLSQGNKGASSYVESRNALQQVLDLLVGIPGGHTAMPELTSVTARGHIQWLGYSDKDRPRWSLNLRLILEPVPAAYSHRESL